MLGQPEFVENPEPRCPCALVLDVSSSMSGKPIKELNKGVHLLAEELRQDPVAAVRVEPAITTFGGRVEIRCEFGTVDDFQPPTLRASGDTHEEGIVHRDIKPENVLVDKKGRVKIADFGLAKILNRAPGETRLTNRGHIMGTPHYMAPEQTEQPLEVDHRADIFSLGVVFYGLLTGELPLGRFGAPSQRVKVDVRLDEVVLRALEKEPDRRYQHANQMGSDVERADSCPKCSSRQIVRTSEPGADVELWRCKRCNTFLAVRPGGDSSESGPG